MIHESAMETYEARLESFGVVYPLLKKKGSHSKGTKNLKWPHKSPTPAQVSALVFLLRSSLSTLKRNSLRKQVSSITQQMGAQTMQHVFSATAIWTGGKPAMTLL